MTVARSMEDIMRVMSIRSAVYVAEQRCPHDEEFDGNDFSATHLLGYVGDEPAGVTVPGISFSKLVTGRSVMPHGLMSWKSRRSVVTLKAKPCEVMPRET